MRIENGPKAVAAFVRALEAYTIKCAALEATGKHHKLAHRLLHEAGIPVAVVNPYRSRQFADSMERHYLSQKFRPSHES